MKRFFFLILLFILFSQNLFSQSLFAWCPDEQIISPKNGFLENKKIDLYIYDSRPSGEKATIKCNGERISKNLIRLLNETYTSADMNIITDKDYFVKPQVNRITIKIGIEKYYVGMDTGVDHQTQHNKKSFMADESKEEGWKAVVGYSLEVIDVTKDEKYEVTDTIFKSYISPKTEDYGVAKDILNKTFSEANRDLIIFLDDVFIYEDAN